MPKLAANLSLLFTEYTFADRFQAAADAGFAGVECLFPYALPATEAAGRLRDAGLEQVLFNFSPGDWDKGERGLAALPGRGDDFKASVDQALAYADALECPNLHCMAGVMPDPEAADRMLACYIENLAYACDQALSTGRTILIEPLNPRDVPGYLLSSTEKAIDIIRAVGRPNLGLQFDFYHIQILEGDLEWRFLSLRDDIRHVQIAGVPARHEPDMGEVDFSHLFRVIDNSGYDGWVGCEYRPMNGTLAGLGWRDRLIDPGI